MGFEGQIIVLWHHDDLGMTRGHNAAFFELVRQRGWTTGSVIGGEHAEVVAALGGPTHLTYRAVRGAMRAQSMP